MLKLNKISINIIDKQTELGESRLEFNIKGDNINYIIMNTIRRTIMNDIPIYAFDEFKFDKNNSVFHNNYLKLRLRHMPVWGIENNIEFKETKETVNNNIDDEGEGEYQPDNIELEVEKKLDSSSLKQMNMYINAKNKTNNIVDITTNDAKFYFGEKQIQSPYKVPIPIVKLQHGQEIAFSSITRLGTEEENAMFSPINVVAYKQINDTEFNFFLESRGQLTEKRILQVALLNIERKIRNFIKLLIEDNNSKDNKKLEGLVIINKEDHTLGNLIARGLQQHDLISFAGYNLPHPLAKKVHFHYKLKKEGNIKKIFEQVVEYYSDLFSEIKKQVDKF
jgi:DNA-directed RNA polymerase subunit L